MFNLDVETNKLKKLKELLNEKNISGKVLEVKKEGAVTTLKFKKQEELDRATEVLKTI